MIKLILYLTSAILATSVFARSSDTDLIERFQNESALFEEIATMFSLAQSEFPSLNHIDLEKHSPYPLKIRNEILDKERSLLKKLHLTSIMKGDFSGLNLTDTVYLLAEEEQIELKESDEHYGVQRGYVRTKGSIQPIKKELGKSNKLEHIEFVPISENWYLYERRYNEELISFDPFEVDE